MYPHLALLLVRELLKGRNQAWSWFKGFHESRPISLQGRNTDCRVVPHQPLAEVLLFLLFSQQKMLHAEAVLQL